MPLDGKTEKDTFKPSTITCPTAITTASTPASPQVKRKATKPLGNALDPSKTRKRMLQQPPGRPHAHRHPRIPEFCQNVSCIFRPHRGMHTPPHQEISHQFQEAILEAGNNATGETYTSLQYHWVVGFTTICKFIPQVCRVFLVEFQDEYLSCPDSPDSPYIYRDCISRQDKGLKQFPVCLLCNGLVGLVFMASLCVFPVCPAEMLLTLQLKTARLPLLTESVQVMWVMFVSCLLFSRNSVARTRQQVFQDKTVTASLVLNLVKNIYF